jgi:hypothetical protein
LKRLKVGDKLVLVKSHYMPHKYLNIPRAIIKAQTNAIKFEGGSWLYFPPAADFVSTEKGFGIMDRVTPADPVNEYDRVTTLEYEVII